MVGFTKKGIMLVLVTMILMVPVFVGAQTPEVGAGQQGFHTTLFTEKIQHLYSGASYNYVSIAEPKLQVGTDVAGQYLLIERVGAGDYFIYPYNGGKKLVLTTRSATTYGGTSGSILIYAGAEETPGNVILAHTGSNSRGNVGVGTSDPMEKLEVNGNIKVSGGGYITSGAGNNVVIRLG